MENILKISASAVSKVGRFCADNEDNFYITSIAHCYPGKSKNGGDRLPPKCCADKWLKKELEYVQNDIYILIGGKAAEYLFP